MGKPVLGKALGTPVFSMAAPFAMRRASQWVRWSV